MKRITKIEANEKLQKTPKKLRVAAYARVSTDSREQLVSLDAQRSHYETCIKSNPDWEYVGLYYDEGISGTSMAKRDGLIKMLDDCEAGKIDFIIIKSISRFARNTTECLEAVRKLIKLKVFIYFEKENINTGDMENELLLTIFSSLAESESISLSENEKWSIEKRFQNGTYVVAYPPYGYKNEDGLMVINDDEVDVVRHIFSECLAGKGGHVIARDLNDKGIPTRRKTQWSTGTVNAILRNEKYIGDALLQKTYTVDILEKKREANKGQVPKYYVENSHEAIIPKDIFLKVQEEISRRANLTKGTTKRKRIYSGRYALSGIVFCAYCGDIFRRIKWNNRGCKSTVWRCVSRVDKDGPDCSARTVHEELLHTVAVKAINETFREKEAILPLLIENIESSLEANTSVRIAAVDEQIKALQHELLATAGIKNSGDELGMEIRRLRDEKQAIQNEEASRQDMKARIDELIAFLEDLPCELTKYDEQFVRMLIDKITVYNDYFIVEFKSGIVIQIDE